MCLFYELWHFFLFQKYFYQSINRVTYLQSIVWWKLKSSNAKLLYRCWDSLLEWYKKSQRNMILWIKVLQRPNEEMLFEKMKEPLTELDESRLIQLSMDRPSVNCNVLEKLVAYLMNNDLPETIDIESCNQHIWHRAFQTAI